MYFLLIQVKSADKTLFFCSCLFEVQSGVDLSIISRFLGHAQLETTRIYATPSVEMMRRAIAKMPMAALDEGPIWDADADAMMAKLCGLR